MNELYKKLVFVSLDLETTGLDSARDSIIEVGLIKFDFDGEIERYESLIHYERRLSDKIKIITGINENELSMAPKWEDVAKRIDGFLTDDVILVGHNIEFDLSFLRVAGVEVDKFRKIDSQDLASFLIFNISSFSLQYLSRYIYWEYNAHRALNDAIAVSVLMKYLFKQINSVSPLVRERLKKLWTKGDFVYQYLFENIWGNKAKIGTVKNVFFTPNDLTKDENQTPIVSNRMIVEANWSHAKNNFVADGRYWLLTNRVFDKMSRKNNSWHRFNSRWNYICKDKLGKLMKLYEIDRVLMSILVKIMLRSALGFWDGSIVQIRWSREEYQRLDEVRCFGENCGGQCFFDLRLADNLKKGSSLVVTSDFLREQKNISAKILMFWNDMVLLEDGITDVLKLNFKILNYTSIFSKEVDSMPVGKIKEDLYELQKNLQIMVGVLDMILKAQGHKSEYGNNLDVTPAIRRDRLFQQITEKFLIIENQAMRILAKKSNKLLLDLATFAGLFSQEDVIWRINQNTSGEIEIVVYPEKLDLSKLGNFEEILIFSRVAGLNGGLYYDYLLSDKYGLHESNLKKFYLSPKDTTIHECGFDIEAVTKKGYNLAVFSSRAKLEAFYESMFNSVNFGGIYLANDVLKYENKNINQGLVLVSYHDLNKLTELCEQFDFIYLNDLIFDVPGELIGSYRSIGLGDDNFDKYFLPRMMQRFKYVLTLIKPEGELVVGDERLFNKSYGRKMMDKLGIK